MDRIIVYPGSIPQDPDILNTNRNTMIGLGYLAQMLAGTSTLVSGLACEPTSPALLWGRATLGSLPTSAAVDIFDGNSSMPAVPVSSVSGTFYTTITGTFYFDWEVVGIL